MAYLRKKDVTDEEARISAQAFLEEMKGYVVKRSKAKEEKAEKMKPNTKKTTKAPKPSREQADYLQSIIDRPNLSVTARGTKLFGFSSNKMTRLKKALMDAGLIRQFTVDLGRKFGGRVALLRLTDLGYQVLNRKPPKGQQGIHQKESLEHLWWKEQIQKDYQARGYKAEIEKELNGKQADIGVSKKDEIVAVEVELSPKNALSNLTKNLEADFSRTLIACKNSLVKKEIERKVRVFTAENNIPESKYRILLLNEFPFIKNLHQEIRG